MKLKGSITIYLSIILVAIILITSVVTESARIGTVQSRCFSFADMANESVLAEYAKQVYDDYGILLAWENTPVKERLEKYLQANINMADLNGRGSNLMGTDVVDIKINSIGYVTDDGGEKFAEQIVAYMKYAGTLKAAKRLLNRFDEYQEGNEAGKARKNDVTDIDEDNSEELQELVEDINEKIRKLKDTEELSEKYDAVSQKIEEIKKSIDAGKKAKKQRKFWKEYRGLMTLTDKKADSVDSAMDLIKKYERKKEQFLKEHSYTSGERDCIDDNLGIMKNIKAKNDGIKELNISDYSKIDSNNVQTIKKAVDMAGAVIDKLQSLTVNEVTEKDKKNKSIYESAKKLLHNGILSLVIDDVSKVSNTSVSDSNLPSQKKKNTKKQTVLKKALNKAFLILYTYDKFGDYFHVKKDDALSYEIEYVLNGKMSDKENLVATIEKLVGIKNLTDLAYIITDTQKMSEISTVAFSASVACGLPFLEPIIKVILLEAWSLAEAINDVKILMRHKKVEVVKTYETWRTDLKNLLSGRNEKNSKGLDYENYCKILMMLQSGKNCTYRIMDLIQMNVQKKYNKNFQMSKCFQKIDMTAKFKTKALFTALPWMKKFLKKRKGSYEFEIRNVKEY